MGWSASEVDDFFGKHLDPNPTVRARKADAIQRYIERVENGPKGKFDPKDVMETVLAHYGLDANFEVEDFVIGEHDGPYGTEDIGYHIVPRKHALDLYEDRPAFTNENGYTFTSWAGEWEAWEEEQYNNDPWPKIEHEGPDNGGNPQLWTPDYLTFYEWVSRYAKQRGEGKTPIFTFPLYDFLGIEPHRDDDGYPIPIEELDDVDGEAKDAYDAKDPKWWGYFWAACKHAGWGTRYEVWDYFWGEKYNELCHPEYPDLKPREAWNKEAEHHENVMRARYTERDKIRDAQTRFHFPEGPVSRWPRESTQAPQRADLVCTVRLDSPQAHARGVTFYLVETHQGGLAVGTPMFHVPSTATSVPGQGLRFLVHYVTQFAQQWRRLPAVWYAPSHDPKSWKLIPLPKIALPGAASQQPLTPQTVQQSVLGPRAQERVWVGPPPPGWVRKPPTGGRGGGISNLMPRRRRRRRK